MKRLLFAGLGLLLVLFIGRLVLTPKIAERGFARQVASNIGVDRTADLPDGLHAYVCGAGSPLPDPKRSGPCLAVLAGDTALVFDAGAGSSGNLGPMGFPAARIDTIFLTHLHSDHFDGLGQMLLGSWIASDRTAPTPVAGPRGTAEVVDGFNRAYRIDSSFRTAHHGADIANPVTFGASARELELEGDAAVVFERDGVTVTAFDVTHDPVAPAFGYRVDYKGRSISISGDTAYDPRVAAASQGVDVLFHEALNMEMVETMERAAKSNGADKIATIMFDIRDYHTSPVDAARIAEQAGAEHLVLTHIVPMLPSDALIPVFVRGADDAFGGPITVAEDGLIVRLPANSDAVVYEGSGAR